MSVYATIVLYHHYVKLKQTTWDRAYHGHDITLNVPSFALTHEAVHPVSTWDLLYLNQCSMTTWHLLHVRFFSFSEDPLKLTLSIRTEVLTCVSKLHILRILRIVGFLLISVTSLVEFLFICLIDRHRDIAHEGARMS